MNKDKGELAKLDCPVSCREYTLPRDDESSIHENSRIGPVLKATITYNQGRYGVEIRIDSLLGDESQPWVMISTRLNKYVTGMPQERQENRFDDTTGACASRPAAKARPPQTSMPMSSSLRTKIPFNKREWIDVEPGKHDQYSFAVAKTLNRLFRPSRRRWSD